METIPEYDTGFVHQTRQAREEEARRCIPLHYLAPTKIQVINDFHQTTMAPLQGSAGHYEDERYDLHNYAIETLALVEG